MSVEQILRGHWRRYGRNYYSRHDYEALDTTVAETLMGDLRASLATLAGRRLGAGEVASASDFSYVDPVDGSTTSRQGVCVNFRDGARAVLRLSGTGTEGATLRVYLERFEADPAQQQQDVDSIRDALKNSKGPGNFRNLFVYSPQGKKDGIQLIPVSEVAAKDEFFNIKNVTRDDLLAAYRVPPQLLGIVPSNTGGFGAADTAALWCSRHRRAGVCAQRDSAVANAVPRLQ